MWCSRIRLDLGTSQRLHRIVLHPMRHHDPAAGGWINGYAFPLQFRIDLSDDVKFERRHNAAAFTGRDYPNPGWIPVAFEARNRTARYGRLTVTKLWSRGPSLPFVFTLGELRVFSGTNNIAAGRPVEANATVEGHGWSKRQLTDGRALCPPTNHPAEAGPFHQHGAIYLRKDFALDKPVARAGGNQWYGFRRRAAVCGTRKNRSTRSGRGFIPL